jgi:hypothetical protein
MTIDLDTFLTTVYCIVADMYQEHFAVLKPRRPGKRPELSDEEVLTLVILAQWQSERSERAFGRYVAKHWRSYFPRLLSQSQFNRRARDLSGVLCALGPRIGMALSEALGAPAYEVLDGVPVPLMRRCRGNRHRCFAEEADMGWGGSDRDFYYGVELLTAVNAHGVITGFVFAPASTEEHWLAEALLRWRIWPQATAPRLDDLADVLPKMKPLNGKPRTRRGPNGPFSPATGVGHATAQAYVTDLGFAGAIWQRHWRLDYEVPVLTQDAFDGQPNQRALKHQWHGYRQVVEQVNQLLTAYLGLVFPRARTPWGLLTRIAAKVAACNLLLTLNHCYDQPLFAVQSPFA